MGALEKGGEASMTGTLRDHWAPDSVNTTLILLALCPGGAPGEIGRWGICRHFARDEGTSPRDVAALSTLSLRRLRTFPCADGYNILYYSDRHPDLD